MDDEHGHSDQDESIASNAPTTNNFKSRKYSPPASLDVDLLRTMYGLPEGSLDFAGKTIKYLREKASQNTGEEPNEFEDLLQWAHDVLKGKQREVVETLGRNNGEYPILDLGTLVRWNNPYGNWNSMRRELDDKAKKANLPYLFDRHDNNARVLRIGQK